MNIRTTLRLAAVVLAVAGGAVALPAPGSAAAPPGGRYLYGWGLNTTRLIAGTVDVRPERTFVDGQPPATAELAIGCGYALARQADGTVWAWGRNDTGQLGRGGTGEPQANPAPVPGLSGITRIAAGCWHALAVAADGTVWAWGLNDHGQLGFAGPDSAVPVKVTAAPKDAVQVAAGDKFSMLLRANGDVWSWGYNYWGTLGDGTDVLDRATPARNKAVYGMTSIAARHNAAAAARPGSVWVWGENGWGVFGEASDAMWSTVPLLVLRDNAVRGLQIGRDNVFALDTDGSYWAWGNNDQGQLGIGEAVHPLKRPRHVTGLGLTSLSINDDNAAGVRADGTLLLWGRARKGLFGDGSTSNTGTYSPTATTAVTGVVEAVAAGDTILVRAAPPPTPDVTGQPKTAAEAALRKLGLVPEVQNIDDDPICDRTNRVASQTPPAGTVVAPGGSVLLQVYAPPPQGCE